jgi:hypothetical protein
MSGCEIFESCIRRAGDLGGVFECDEETGYFYLFDIARDEARRVVDAIRVLAGRPDFTQRDISVRWDRQETRVGLFIRGVLWAVFDTAGSKYGGEYNPNARPVIPPEVVVGFRVSQA